ncbi:MAG: polysaccharide deacetylase family protein [Bacteroidales bacterium]
MWPPVLLNKKYFIRTPSWLMTFYPNRIWRIPAQRSLFLTFDDGPDPVTTPRLLDLLDKYQAKASFFCLGENARAHPDILNRIITEGHTLGTHGTTHLDGWESDTESYIENIRSSADDISTFWFRPPYGRITSRQERILRQNYKIVMWSLMPGDFDATVSDEELRRRIVEKTREGDIIVLHDRTANPDRLLGTVDELLKYFTESGYKFLSLDNAVR